jgi:integrase
MGKDAQTGKELGPGIHRQRGRRHFMIKYYHAGRARFEAAPTLPEARRLLKQRHGEIAAGRTPVTRRVTLDAALDDVVQDYRQNRRRTVADVERRIRLHLQPGLDVSHLADVTGPVIRRYVARRVEAGAENATINRELAVLKRACRLAHHAGLLGDVPYIALLDERNVRSGFFEREAFDAVREALPEVWRPPVTVAYLTGWRLRAEILPLQWRHVDWAAGVVRLDAETTKNREGRLFPFDVLPELQATFEGQKGKSARWVFPNATGDDRLTAWIGKTWREACEAAGVAGQIPHDLRRTAVRNLVRAGIPEKTAMTLTGHKTRAVFDRYDIVNEADLREAVRRLTAHPIAHPDPP